MKWLLGILVGLAALIGVAIFALPMLISTETLVSEAEKQASTALGRDVTIGSIGGVSILPPRLSINDLTVGSGDGFEAENLVTVSEASLAVRLMPLFSQRVEIETFILREPQIFLETRADGTNNYTFEGAPAEETRETEGPSEASAPATGRIVVENGALSWVAPDQSYSAEDVDLTLVLPPLGEPLTLDGSMRLEELPARVGLEVAEPWAMTANQASDLSFDVDLAGNKVGGSFNALAEPLRIEGPLSVKLPQLAALTPLLGAELVEAAAPFGVIEVSGQAKATADTVQFAGARFATALASGSGDFSAALAGERPKLTGSVAAGRVDLRPFFPEAMQEEESPTAGEGFPAWSEEPMDFSGLKAADADVSMTAGEIVLPTYSITGIAAKARLQGGRANMSLDRGRAFGGDASGNLSLDARQATPTVGAVMEFASVNFGEAAPALLGTKRLFGKGTIGFDVSTRGQSQKAFIDALTGSATADIENGLVDGIDLSALATTGIALIEELQSDRGKLPAVTSSFNSLRTNVVGADSKTNFDVADFDLAIENGAVSIGEAKLLTDTVRTTVRGNVSLPAQGLDLRILLAAKAPEATGFREFRLPVSVGGTFSKPTFGIDTKPLASEIARGAASDALGRAGIDVSDDEKIEDAIKDKARDELRGFLGNLGRKKKDEPKDDEAADEPADAETTDEEPEAPQR
ncbi:AsmA family protein [Parvularcula sp. ZS-1/3]|uniref:AsmA family protein n=1 Tax=Parvularcula mediterranea TaxID=2732508 RepID=A0A7Y3W4H9_9PROT|nr:AsmA family protein [Parvularcula mediterranea]NNU15261.1 AsmA family protein [Parvularcula mediterranea]